MGKYFLAGRPVDKFISKKQAKMIIFGHHLKSYGEFYCFCEKVPA